MEKAIGAVVVSHALGGPHILDRGCVHRRARASQCERRRGLRYRAYLRLQIGSDVGNPGEREFQTQTTGRFGKGSGTYRALGQEVEIEIVPLPNFRVEVGGIATLHDITGVPDINDRRQFNFQGLSLDCVIACLAGRTPRSG